MNAAGKLAAMFLAGDAARQLSAKQAHWLRGVCSQAPASCREVGYGRGLVEIDGDRLGQFVVRYWPNGTAALQVQAPPDPALASIG